MTSKTNNSAAAAPAPEAVTVHQSVGDGILDMFEVRPGVPLVDAMDSLATLLNVAHEALHDVVMNLPEDDRIQQGVPWAVDGLLLAAGSLQSAIHAGYMRHQKQLAEAGRG